MQADRSLTQSGGLAACAKDRGAFDPLDASIIERAIADAGEAWQVRVVDTTDSTNTDLLADVRRSAGRDLPALLAARHQRAGRGRLGRTWVSAVDGSLTASFALSIARHMASLEGVTLVCGLAVAAVVARLGVPVRLKWPNDVLVGDRKLAGILVEAHASGAATALVVGVGLNLDGLNLHVSSHPAHGIAATSLREAGITAPDRNALVTGIALALAERCRVFETEGFGPFVDAWRDLDAFTGRNVEVRMAGPARAAGKDAVKDGGKHAVNCAGKYAGIDATGALLLDVDGATRRFTGGDISLRPAP